MKKVKQDKPEIPKILKGYKAFNQDMTCKEHKFEIGKTYKTDDAVICQKGFHFCLNPLDLFNYYSPAESKFAEVEGMGKIVTHLEDTKIACTEIKIGAEVNWNTLIKAGIDFIFSKVKKTKSKKTNKNEKYSLASNTGYRSAASNTGDRSAASNTGYRSAASNTGDSSAAEVSGKQSIACGLGIENKARGKKSCWLVLTEWHKVNEKWQIKDCQTQLVDGEKIKEDTWYILKNGRFEEI